MPLIHSSKTQPRIYPINGNVSAVQIDRIQDITEDITMNRERRKEVGSAQTIDYKNSTPDFRYSMRQFEYGSLELYRKLANKGDAVTQIALTDFNSSISDIAVFLTDDDSTFKGTIWMPKLRVNGFTINIADPEADTERNFDLVGEDYKIFQGNNKYLVQGRATCATADATKVITINNPAPVQNPDDSTYFLRVTRYNGSTTEELELTTDYTWNNGLTQLTVTGNSVGDIITYYYTATTYVGTIWTDNTSDVGAYPASHWSVYVGSGNYLYRLQSASIEVSMNRFDLGEIGNTEKVQFGNKDSTVRINLGRILEAFTLEEILRGQTAGYGVLDAREYLDNITFYARLYDDEAKTSHKLTYKCTNCTPASMSGSRPKDDYITQNVILEADNLAIATTAI